MISFCSAHRGVGKSLIAFYSAVAWADWASCKVLYVPFDFVTGEKFRRRLGIEENPPNEAGRDAQILLSQYGVGVLPLARSPAELSKMDMSAAVKMLVRLNRTYDLFIDIDSYESGMIPPNVAAFGESLIQESDHAFGSRFPGETIFSGT
jgi:hypothetical protein